MLKFSICIAVLFNLKSEAAITGPKTAEDAPIRLAKATGRASQKSRATTPNEHQNQNNIRPKLDNSPGHHLPQTSSFDPVDTSQQWNLHSEPGQFTENNDPMLHVPQQQKQESIPVLKPVSTKINIVEPPDGVYIAGSKFLVLVEIMTSSQEIFDAEYGTDASVCLSLDEGPYHCWPLNKADIGYTNAVDGLHTLVAKIYRKHQGDGEEGVLEEETASEVVTFTTVSDPKMAAEEDPERSYHHQRGLAREEVSDEDDDSKAKNGTDTSDDEEDETKTVSFPVVQMDRPVDRASYTGSQISLKPFTDPEDPEIFQKYFRYGHICYNIDIATAYACFPIFNNVDDTELDFFVVDLGNGMHTLEASLAHPQTGELLDGSSTGTMPFFMAGKDNGGASFVAEINIRGKLHKIPIVRGGCLIQQTKVLCASIGLDGDRACFHPVHQHLQLVASQTGFITSQSSMAAV